jgi:hypothetical protein
MTIRPRWLQPIPSGPFFTPTISLAKMIFRRLLLTIFVRLAKFSLHQDEASLLTNLLIRGKVVSLIGDVVVTNGKPADRLPLLGAETGE